MRVPMLNRQKLSQKLYAIKNDLFLDVSSEKIIAKESWKRLVSDPFVLQKIQALDTPWIIPSWQGKLDYTVSIMPYTEPYCVVAIDGSQVYPDRHEGIGCYLINIGVAQLMYGMQLPVFFSSEPIIFTGFDEENDESSHDIVNCKRQEYELKASLEAVSAARQLIGKKHALLLLCDGSLIFWHLESKGHYLRERFLYAYLHSLQQLYEYQVLNAGYISMPKSKELVNLIRVELCNFEMHNCHAYKQVQHIVDATIVPFFVQKHMRSNLFKSTASIVKYYPEHLAPYFFYLDVGSEIVRIEIPAWIADDEKLVNQVASLILDQTIKGYGYPVALAESHEQAVIKGPDREFFYLLLSKMSVDQKKSRIISCKSAKKRGIGI